MIQLVTVTSSKEICENWDCGEQPYLTQKGFFTLEARPSHEEIEARRKAFLRKRQLKCKNRRRQLGGSGRSTVHFRALPTKPMAFDPNHERLYEELER